MAPNRRRQLDALYAQVPDAGCKGQCWASCGPIEMSSVERRRIAAAGYNIPPPTVELLNADHPTYCPALGADRSCAVYELRPMICRLWGVSVDMPCPHGCRPERYLSRQESMGLLAAASKVAGDGVIWTGSDVSPDEFLAIIRTARGGRVLDAVAARGRAGDIRRMMHQEEET